MTQADDGAFAIVKTRIKDASHTYGKQHPVGDTYSSGGLTKREYFASAAMQSVIASGNERAILGTAKEHGITPQLAVARLAVAHADALIEALNKV